MVTRGTRAAGIQGPEHAVDVATALQLYTNGTARLLGETNRVGSIAVGGLADLVGYDTDPLTTDPEELTHLTPVFVLNNGVSVHDPDGRLVG